MRQQIQSSRLAVVEQTPEAAELDLVIPFTTPAMTRVALSAAEQMGEGLNAALRLVRVQIVPFPLELDQSPVQLDFLKNDLERYDCGLPLRREIRLSRDLKEGLLGTLARDSVVVLATRWRPWSTPAERLAAWLQRASFKVVLISGKAKNA